MNKNLIKLILCVLSVLIILNVSCKSTAKGTPPAASDVPEQVTKNEEAIATEDTNAKDITKADDTATEEITEAEEDVNEFFIEELIAEFMDILAEPEPVPPPAVTAVTPPPPPPAPPAPVPVTPPPPPPPTPPPAPTVQVPPAQSEPEEAAEEPAPAPAPARRNVPDYPPTRLDSLTQMGMTPLDSEIIYSRIVRATVGQTLEIPFRGNGWVYLGETASRRGIVYNSRRSDSEGQSFIFSLEEAGVYTLRFYRQDFIRDFIINDHVQVIVGEPLQAEAGWFNPSADRGRVVAMPRWPSPLEEAQIRSGARLPSEPVVTAEPTPQARSPGSAQSVTPTPRASSQPSTTAQPPAAATRPSAASTPPAATTQAPVAVTPSSTAATQPPASRQPDAPQTGRQTAEIASVAPPSQETQEAAPARAREVMAPEVLLQKAQESFEGGNAAESIALLNQFLEDYPGGSDEVYWLLGQYYEANSPSRNILLSIDYYKRLVNEYPQSRRLNDARRRISYLERFYINIQ